jgi:predicted DNA-binding transcriptional regulator AlpA
MCTVNLMGAAEIAKRLGVSRQRVFQITNGKGFPDPVTKLAMGNVWRGEDVEDWIRQHRPDLAQSGG